jgi:hypothetical protein
VRHSLSLIALALALALAACSPSTQHTPTASTTSDDPSAAGEAPATTSEANATSAQDDADGLRASYTGFPSFDPPYPGASDVSGGTLGPHSGLGSFSTTDTPAQVGAFFAHAGQGAGLQPRPHSDDPGQVYTAAGPAGNINVTAATMAGVTHVTTRWTTPG